MPGRPQGEGSHQEGDHREEHVGSKSSLGITDELPEKRPAAATWRTAYRIFATRALITAES
jgi:hypothetical protein